MRIAKLKYFNIYVIYVKFLPLIFSTILFICCEKKQSQQVFTQNGGKIISENAVNINSASLEELKKLPNIGDKTAQNIIEHREKYGKFRKPEHLLLIQGISDNKFRQIKEFIKIE